MNCIQFTRDNFDEVCKFTKDMAYGLSVVDKKIICKILIDGKSVTVNENDYIYKTKEGTYAVQPKYIKQAKDHVQLANKNIQFDSSVDGVGLRMVLWMQGCTHNCKNCHNPETHDITKGYSVPLTDIYKQIDSNTLDTGITISGGDPFEQPNELLEIVKYCKSKNLNVWVYTGYKYKEVIKIAPEVLNYIDVLVDGRFVEELKDPDLLFRGSSNQRLINIPLSLKHNHVELYKEEG